VHSEWIGLILFPPDVLEHIQTKHNLTREDVNDAATLGHHESAVFKEHTPYGPRLMVIGRSTGMTGFGSARRPTHCNDQESAIMGFVDYPDDELDLTPEQMFDIMQDGEAVELMPRPLYTFIEPVPTFGTGESHEVTSIRVTTSFGGVTKQEFALTK
jgi:hypothetical protein